MLRILSNTDVESDREKTNSDISTLVPYYNRIWMRISILGADTDTDAKNLDNHFHIPTLKCAHRDWSERKQHKQGRRHGASRLACLSKVTPPFLIGLTIRLDIYQLVE